MGKSKAKMCITYRIATFDGNVEFYVHCRPQQRWKYSVEKSKVKLSRNEIDMYIPKEEFEQSWEVLE